MGLDVENEAGEEVGGKSRVLDLGDFLPFTERKVREACAREAGGKMAHLEQVQQEALGGSQLKSQKTGG